MSILADIKKEIFMAMKFTDSTVDSSKKSSEYLQKQAYNQGLRDAMKIMEKHLQKNKEDNHGTVL